MEGPLNLEKDVSYERSERTTRGGNRADGTASEQPPPVRKSERWEKGILKTVRDLPLTQADGQKRCVPGTGQT